MLPVLKVAHCGCLKLSFAMRSTRLLTPWFCPSCETYRVMSCSPFSPANDCSVVSR